MLISLNAATLLLTYEKLLGTWNQSRINRIVSQKIGPLLISFPVCRYLTHKTKNILLCCLGTKKFGAHRKDNAHSGIHHNRPPLP